MSLGRRRGRGWLRQARSVGAPPTPGPWAGRASEREEWALPCRMCLVLISLWADFAVWMPQPLARSAVYSYKDGAGRLGDHVWAAC